MMENVRLLVVEDHFLARIALHSIFDREPGMTIVAETAQGDEAVELYRRHRPEVVIMDIRLAGSSGLDAVAAIRRVDPEARVLILSNYSGSEDVYRGFRCGARGYLTKEASGEQLVEAVRVLAKGGRYLPPSLGASLAERVPAFSLTDRELEVLQLLADGKNTAEIAVNMKISPKTVRIHISNILNKLGVHDRTQALAVALKQGIVHLENPGVAPSRKA
ncbi:MAG: response regulator transcription factor [Bryobacteraceae bacterium]|jgi:DNA-binding NarL/FixJ family response regulator